MKKYVKKIEQTTPFQNALLGSLDALVLAGAKQMIFQAGQYLS